MEGREAWPCDERVGLGGLLADDQLQLALLVAELHALVRHLELEVPHQLQLLLHLQLGGQQVGDGVRLFQLVNLLQGRELAVLVDPLGHVGLRVDGGMVKHEVFVALQGHAASNRAQQLLPRLHALLYIELTPLDVGDYRAGLAELLAALEVSSDLVLGPVQLGDLLGLHQQLHLGVAVQPALERLLQDGVAHLDLEDVPRACSQGLQHQTRDCFVYFGVFYDV